MPTKQIDVIVKGRVNYRTRPDLMQAITPYLSVCWELGHEIANPLSGIIGLAEELLTDDDESLSGSQRESLTHISDCADRINECLMTLADAKSIIMEDDYVRNRMLSILGRPISSQ